MRPRILLPLAATFALACAGVASADSLAYIKDGNVWLSSPDASKAYQVTFDGGYSSPSQSDNGTIAALRGAQMVRMDRRGQQLNAPIDGMGSPAANNGNFYGPYEPRISPDGSKIAYWFGQYTSYYDYGCNCSLYRLESRTTWSYADHFTDPSSDSDYYKGVEQPEWLTDDHLLTQYPMFWMNIWTWQIGAGHGYVNGSAQYATSWRDNEGTYFDLGDPDLSPDGSHIAVTDSGDATNNTRLLLGHVNGPIWTGSFPTRSPTTSTTRRPPTRRRIAHGRPMATARCGTRRGHRTPRGSRSPRRTASMSSAILRRATARRCTRRSRCRAARRPTGARPASTWPTSPLHPSPDPALSPAPTPLPARTPAPASPR